MENVIQEMAETYDVILQTFGRAYGEIIIVYEFHDL